jgi:hypothetical protein
MSNYQEGSGSYAAGSQPPAGVNPYQEAGYQEASYQDAGAQHQGGPSFETGPQHHVPGGYQGGPGYTETQRFQGSPQQHRDSGQGQYQGSGFGPSRHLSVRSTFKTTEFWIFVVVSLALLIAAAVTDSGVDGQGFGAKQAWLYVTVLAVAYMLSRGLTKFGGHERDGDRRS